MRPTERVGVFGGSFDPPHLGHLTCLQEVFLKSGLDRVILIPASQNPFKTPIEGPSPQQRLEMTKAAVQDWGPQFSVDDQEVRRGGLSYTCETIEALQASTKAFSSSVPIEQQEESQVQSEWYLILGVDHLEELGQWKNIEDLLNRVHLIMMSRPGFDFPKTAEDLPKVLSQRVKSWAFNTAELEGGKTLQFLRVKEVSISSSEIRKAWRSGRHHLVSSFLPLAVERYIEDHQLYISTDAKISDFESFSLFCAKVLSEKKAIQIRGFDLRGGGSEITDFSLVVSGTSSRHTTALAENLIHAVKEKYNTYPLGIEGMEEGRWIVVDYGALMVHLFYDFIRHEYALEKLWKNGRPLNIE